MLEIMNILQRQSMHSLVCAGLLKFMGVFKTAPTGAGTFVAATTVAATAATTAAVGANHWAWFTAHWPIL